MTEASSTAIAALQLAERAHTQIASHELVCAERWRVVVRVALWQLGVIVSVCGALLYDKFL